MSDLNLGVDASFCSTVYIYWFLNFRVRGAYLHFVPAKSFFLCVLAKPA